MADISRHTDSSTSAGDGVKLTSGTKILSARGTWGTSTSKITFQYLAHPLSADTATNWLKIYEDLSGTELELSTSTQAAQVVLPAGTIRSVLSGESGSDITTRIDDAHDGERPPVRPL